MLEVLVGGGAAIVKHEHWFLGFLFGHSLERIIIRNRYDLLLLFLDSGGGQAGVGLDDAGARLENFELFLLFNRLLAPR